MILSVDMASAAIWGRFVQFESLGVCVWRRWLGALDRKSAAADDCDSGGLRVGMKWVCCELLLALAFDDGARCVRANATVSLYGTQWISVCKCNNAAQHCTV